MFTVLAAADIENGIGKFGKIPWHAPNDMKHFKRLTTGNIIIMGKTTYESIGKSLPNRINCIISRTLPQPDDLNTHVFRDPWECVRWCQKNRTCIKTIEDVERIKDIERNKRVESMLDAKFLRDDTYIKNTKQKKIIKDIESAERIKQAESEVGKKGFRKIYVCGGESIYKWFYDNELVSSSIITRIYNRFGCDKFIKIPNKGFTDLFTDLHQSSVSAVEYIRVPLFNSPLSGNCDKDCDKDCERCTEDTDIITQHFKNDEELSFLNLIRRILKSGNATLDRTGTGTISLFGEHLKFSLENNTLPMMTSRPIFLRGVFEELMFFLRGYTDTTILEKKNVNIWKGNTSRQFLDKRKLEHFKVGDMGHTYGFSFRHFGADYKGCDADYTDQGYDQLFNLIKGLKENPYGRRHIISLWEPNHMHNASLPPCMYQYQFNVNSGKLSCMITQRSSDVVTALNWNICAASLLTHMLSWYCDLKPGTLIWNGGNVHIYNNLIDAAKNISSRRPTVFPKIFLKNMPCEISLVEFYNIEILNYSPLPKGNIQITMNV